MTAKKQWIQSATVGVNPENGAMLVDIAAPNTFVGGTKIPAVPGVAEPLVDQPTPCRFVWIGTPINDGMERTNTGVVFIGDANNQNMPLLPRNYRGVVIRIDDASILHIRTIEEGDGVVFRITSGGPVEDVT